MSKNKAVGEVMRSFECECCCRKLPLDKLLPSKFKSGSGRVYEQLLCPECYRTAESARQEAQS